MIPQYEINSEKPRFMSIFMYTKLRLLLDAPCSVKLSERYVALSPAMLPHLKSQERRIATSDSRCTSVTRLCPAAYQSVKSMATLWNTQSHFDRIASRNDSTYTVLKSQKYSTDKTQK